MLKQRTGSPLKDSLKFRLNFNRNLYGNGRVAAKLLGSQPIDNFDGKRAQHVEPSRHRQHDAEEKARSQNPLGEVPIARDRQLRRHHGVLVRLIG
jgi:hypothetical protein